MFSIRSAVDSSLLWGQSKEVSEGCQIAESLDRGVRGAKVHQLRGSVGFALTLCAASDTSVPGDSAS